MVYIPKIVSVLALTAAVFDTALAHPGHDPKAEAEERAVALQTFSKRSLAHCSAKLKARGHTERAIARRSAWADDLRKRHFLDSRPFLKARDLSEVLNTSHHSNRTGLSVKTNETELFSNDGANCVLQPEVTEGPYYVSGEFIRSNVKENQTGVPLYADIQVLDMDTCEPLTNIYVDLWHCNSTGVYSGVSAAGDGDSVNETSNLNATFLRGIQQTDKDGVVRFESLFPGHYTGRATHIHILGHQTNTTRFANGTIAGTTAMHVGQLFFDQDLISTVEATSPYSTNTQNLTLNDEDSILASEANSSDPMMEYVLLGDSISDGLLAWISIGVNTSYVYNADAAATLTSSGGVANANGFGGGNGTFPSGSGAPPTSTAAAKFRFF